VNLETLWLNDNLINELEGLTALVNLRCCFLASNKIDRVGNGFDCCTLLEEVNLANNLIVSSQAIILGSIKRRNVLDIF